MMSNNMARYVYNRRNRYDGKELLEFISTRPAEQGRDRRPAIKIKPDNSQLRTGGKSLLFTITVQPEDALVLIHKIRYPDIEQLTVTR